MFITYEEYKDMGGGLSETAFKRNIDRACAIVDDATSGRIANMQEVPGLVKALCRDLVEYLSSNSITEKTVASRSQSAGNTSESESYVEQSQEEQKKDIDNLIYDYLLSVSDSDGTPLLYRGCGR